MISAAASPKSVYCDSTTSRIFTRLLSGARIENTSCAAVTAVALIVAEKMFPAPGSTDHVDTGTMFGAPCTDMRSSDGVPAGEPDGRFTISLSSSTIETNADALLLVMSPISDQSRSGIDLSP